MQQEKDWLDYIVAIGTITTPILVLALTAIGWRLRSSFERKVELENKLRDDRISVYNDILEPFIILLMSDAAWASNPKNKAKDKTELATRTMLSLDYRRLGFRLALLAPDSLVKSYNDLMQYIYRLEEHQRDAEHDFSVDMIKLLGNFLVEIRKSMGNEATELNHWDMCEWWMSDVRAIKERLGN